jgi:hypothetical protein
VPDPTDIDQNAWAKSVASSPAFDFLKESAEDIYSRGDGKPFHDKR